jgi:opacity protein-like surface antigen
MWKTCIASVAAAVLASASISTAAKHHHKQAKLSFKERFVYGYAAASFDDRFGAERFGPHVNDRRYPGMWVGKYYVGTDPDINVRFELVRDFARVAGHY